MAKLKTGILYQDKTVTLSRSASGVVSFWCHGPIQIWVAAGTPSKKYNELVGSLCIETNLLKDHDDGSVEEMERSNNPFKRKRK